MALIEELRAKHRALIENERSIDDFLASSRRYAGLRKQFERRVQRIPRSKSPLTFQKKRECSILFHFLLEYERLPPRWIALGEHPDFRFSVGQRRVGMELVEGFVPHPSESSSRDRGSIRRQQEEIQDAIAARAMDLHTKRGGCPLRVSLSFGDTDFRKADIPKVAATVAALIPCDVQGATFIHPTVPWLHFIQVSPRPECVRDLPRWDACHGGTVSSAESVLPAIIRTKEQKLDLYRKARCDEYWLLIFVQGIAASSFIRLVDRRKIFTSKFDKVFLFSPNRPHDERVMRLNVAKV